MSKINPLGPVWIPGLLLDLFKSEKKDNPKTKDTNKKTSADISDKNSTNNKLPQEKNSTTDSIKNNINNKKHLIAKGETLFRIATNYGVTVSELIEANPDLEIDKNGNRIIQEGAFLNIPKNSKTYKTSENKIKNPKEQTTPRGIWKIEKSKGAFSIMSKFNLYKEELQKLNPDIDLDNIKADQEFKVPGYEVKSGDTLYKIAKEHDITEKMLKELNPNLKTLKAGDIINVPKKAGEDLGLGDIEIEIEEFTAEEISTYTVKPGDTLYRIAQNNNIPVWALMLVNDIKDPQKLAKDQILTIPSAEEVEELEKTQQNIQQKEKATSNKIHKIKVAKDESLSVIAERHNIPVWALAAKNNIENPNKLGVGQILEIPDKNEIVQLKTTNLKNKTTPKVKSKTTKKIKITSQTEKNDYGAISPKMGLVNHKVKPKDTVTSIAKEYGIDVKDIIAYNNLQGKSLTIPLSKQKITNIKIVGNQSAVKAVTGVSQDFIDNLISLEKKKNKLYDDGCGFLTIGIGHNTNANKDTRKYRSRKISDTEIYSLLARDIITAQKIAQKHLKNDFNKLTSKQKEALYSLIFNTGGLNSSPKLVKAIKEQKNSIAAQQFDQIYGTVNGKKQVLPGLAKRRFVESATFVKGSYLNKKELRQVMSKIQEIYDKGYHSIKNPNNRVDYNAYAKKFLGDFIDKGYIKIRS